MEERFTVPLVAGIQRFDETIIPNDFNISAGASARATDYQYITASTRRDAGPSMSNMIIWGDNAKNAYATQRPPIKAAQNNIAATGSGVGRGIHRDSDNRVVSVVGTSVSTVKVTEGGFLSEASTTIDGTLSSDGHDKVYMVQSGDDELAIVDPENDDVYKFDMTGTGTLTLVSDVDLPASIARGAVWLNNKLYICTPGGRIYNSDSGDVTSWDALNFISVERKKGNLQTIEFHHDHIAAFTDKTIEFFYDNANATGSPLRRRDDIFYNTGTITETTEINDVIYFIGRAEGGSYGIYALDNFQLEKISDDRVNMKLETMVKGSGIIYINGMMIDGRAMLCIMAVNDRSEINNASVPDPEIKDTVWYDTKYQALYDWTSAASALDPMVVSCTSGNMAMTFQGTPIYFKGILSENVADDTDEDQTTSTEVAIACSLHTPSYTMGTSKRKYWTEFDIDGHHAQNIDDLAIDIDFYWSDDFYENTTVANKRTVDYKELRFKERGLGSSRQRAFYLDTSTKVRLFLKEATIAFDWGD